ncbi:MAG TPA: acyl-CoA thioesterase, partial [Gaiellaceae bacterium]
MSERAPDTCSAPYRVRFDEAAPDGWLRTSVVLRYAQDLAWHHSASRGFGRAWYGERGLSWLVRAAEIAVLAPVEVGAEIEGTTQVVGWRRVWARR